MLSNREYAYSSTSKELGTISNEVEPPHSIELESGHQVWKDRVFRIQNKVIPVEWRPGVRRFVTEHVQNLDNVIANVVRAGATIAGEIFDWC